MFLKVKPELLPAYSDETPGDAALFNMAGDYSYLSEGYYLSQDACLRGKRVFPSPEEILDAYVVPLALEKARQNKIATPEYKITNDEFGIEPPVLLYPINPFSDRFELVSTLEDAPKKFRTVTRLGKYAACVQELPHDDYRIDTLRCIMGKTLTEEYHEFAWKAFKTFGLPLMKIRVIVTSSQYLFSSICPLEFDQLTLNEKKILEGIGTWQD
ncbi:MAG TPA: RimK-like ATPgrasp N-terminal domain-containing protein [Bacillota bacterium]|nr:RimK-like ATPgrasp N-terminal domain-containing protein [Bacillota bacterium]